MRKFKSAFLIKVVLLLNLVLIAHSVCANTHYPVQELLIDSVTISNQKIDKSDGKAERKQKKAEGKKLLKDSHSRFLIDV
jgi:hypothetical protein